MKVLLVCRNATTTSNAIYTNKNFREEVYKGTVRHDGDPVQLGIE